MKPMRMAGVFEDRGFLWTQNRNPGTKVYGERLRLFKGKEYRDWNPYRSKLAALARRSPETQWIDPQRDVLYLGASSGTTVSHVSDMLRGDARCFAVEFSPRSVRDLLWNTEPRDNVIPLLEDARKPERYAAYFDRPVGSLVQDVAQRDQVDIFVRNLPFLHRDGLGFLFVKARSIHVARPLPEIYAEIEQQLKAANLNVIKSVDLEPFERDHRAYVVKQQ